MTSASAEHHEGTVALQQREAGWGDGVEGASLEMPSVLNPECREEPSPWGECIQVEGTVSAKAGVSVSV